MILIQLGNGRMFYAGNTHPVEAVAFQDFISRFPLYLETSIVDVIRDREYPHLDAKDQVCLDYQGIGIFSYQQYVTNVACHFTLAYVAANLALHAKYSEDHYVENIIRKRLLSYLNIDEKDYCVVLTANTYLALKVVIESFPFNTSSKLLLGYDAQNEEIDRACENARSKGTKILGVSFTLPSLTFEENDLRKKLGARSHVSRDKKKPFEGLFAYPAYSLLTGTKNSLKWVTEAQQHGWAVLLDVSGVEGNEIDSLGIAEFHPDFITGSFYKVFGFNPAGFGCLAIRKDMLCELRDTSEARATGVVKVVSPSSKDPHPSSSNDEMFHDTQNMVLGNVVNTGKKQTSQNLDHRRSYKKEQSMEDNRMLVARRLDATSKELKFGGLSLLEEVGPTRVIIRSKYLVNWLISSMLQLLHPHPPFCNLVQIHGPLSATQRGTTIAFSLLDHNGEYLDLKLVQRLADRSNISLGLGSIQRHLLSNSAGKPGSRREKINVLCVTIGFLTNFNDVFRLWKFLTQFLDLNSTCANPLQYKMINQKTVLL